MVSTLPWVEKYRPKTVSDVSHQEEVVATLQKAVATGAHCGDLPHLLLYGPPGTGKTSAALALCRDLFGAGDLYHNRVLELNASDERGISVVREKIKGFAQRSVAASSSVSSASPCPPFKIILLDEADAITADAQTALRRTMEAHSKTTRFVLICNYVSRIIAPLASRCAKFRFKPLPCEAMSRRLRFVAKREGVQVDARTLDELINASGGDLRKALTTLQSAHRIAMPGEPVSAEDVATAACAVPSDILDSFDTATLSSVSAHKSLRELVDTLVRSGYSAADLLVRYSDRLTSNDGPGVGKLLKLQKAAIALSLAEADSNLNQGGDEVLQLYDVVSKIAVVARNPTNRDVLRAI